MFSALVEIILGILVAFVAPEWLKFGDRKSRSTIQLVMNVIGIIMIILGIISFIKSL